MFYNVGGSDLTSLKVAQQSKEAEAKKIEARRKSIIILILQFLKDNGYLRAMESLQAESNLNLIKFGVADNLDLNLIVQEFETFYAVKYNGKSPKLVKSLHPIDSLPPGSYHGAGKSTTTTAKKTGTVRLVPSNALPPLIGNSKEAITASNALKPVSPPISNMGIVGNSLSNSNSASELEKALPESNNNSSLDPNSNASLEDSFTFKAIPEALDIPEYRDLALIVQRDIIVHNPTTTWDDIAGLSQLKRIVQEAIVYPVKYPDYYDDWLQPWKALLMYGPPGNGKTLIAQAIASECNTTFFNVSASSLISKWRGESEKLVKTLFIMARAYQPSTIFIDEIESVWSHRSSSNSSSDNESNRRLKTEFLVQMDGLIKHQEKVFILAATNCPWDIDTAFVRRLEKRIYVPLPDEQGREQIFKSRLELKSHRTVQAAANLDYPKLASLSQGYSASDIDLVCKEACMKPIREAINALELGSSSSNNNKEVRKRGLPPPHKINPVIVTMEHLIETLQNTKPSCDASASQKRFQSWSDQFQSI